MRLIAALLILIAFPASAQEPTLATEDERVEMLAWIPHICCVTNNCCFEVQLSDLYSLDGDKWQIKATGQILPRTDWSRNGKYIRCACDSETSAEEMKPRWRVHSKANTRCIFVPPQGS